MKNNTRQLLDKIYATTVITGSQLFPNVKETLAEIPKQPYQWKSSLINQHHLLSLY